MNHIHVSDHEMAVLGVLFDHYHHDANCLYFRFIAEETGLDVKQVRRSCRALARKGLAEYVRGLFNEDGMVGGSGYRCTLLGHERYEASYPRKCDECGIYPADPPSTLCPGCEAYREHTGAM